MIKQIQLGSSLICYDDTFISNPEWPLFDSHYWQQQNKVIGSAEGRGTTWFVQLESIQAALRHYRRGGLFGKLVKDHYWFSNWSKTRSIAEFELLLVLREAGVNVPRPIAARAVKTGCTYQADLLSEKIAHAQDLVAILQLQSLPAVMYQKIGAEIAKMHKAQVNHTDLNIHNILIDSKEQVWIIDFDKCQQQSGDDWKLSNLERLKRSFVKEQQRFNIQWHENEWQTLLQGYQG